MNRKIFVLLLSLSTLAMSASRAAVLLVQDQAAFLLQVNGIVTENFDSIALAGGYLQTPSLSTSVGTFTNTNMLYVATWPPGDGSQFLDSDGGGSTTLTLIPGYSAAGSLVFRDNASPSVISSIIVTDSNNATYTFNSLSIPAATGAPSTRFIGFIADGGTTIKSIQYAQTAGLSMDNYMVAVPEPSTVAVLAFGGVALSLLHLRKRKI